MCYMSVNYTKCGGLYEALSEHGGSVLRQQTTCEVQWGCPVVRQSWPQSASVLSEVGSYLGQRRWSASLLHSARYTLQHKNRHVLHCRNLQCRILKQVRIFQHWIFRANSRLNRCCERVYRSVRKIVKSDY